MIPKYPRTPYWPTSPSIAEGDKTVHDASAFVGREVVVTEKLDGGNTMLHLGHAYARSVSAPTTAKWFAMVKKHHAWKIWVPKDYLYGEDIYGVHSIEYDAVKEQETFRAFALRRRDVFVSFDDLRIYCGMLAIPVVPVLFEGVFRSEDEIDAFLAAAHKEPSILGGEREGMVIRTSKAFHADEFADNVCKSVRPHHVQTDEHWTRNWRSCSIAK